MKRLAFTVVLLGATASFAIDPAPAVVPVQVDVVRASTDGSGQTEVPPSLKKMQSDLSSRIKYSSMKVVSTKQLQLKKQAEIIDLPNQNHAIDHQRDRQHRWRRAGHHHGPPLSGP